MDNFVEDLSFLSSTQNDNHSVTNTEELPFLSIEPLAPSAPSEELPFLSVEPLASTTSAIVTSLVELAPVSAPEPKPHLRDNLGNEIYEIFVEEINEIHTNLVQWVPEWIANRSNKELLRDIRRGFHTCKGSGRMAGALALGDYAWAHEQTINKVLEGHLPVNDQLISLLQRAVDYLGKRLEYFLSADYADEAVKQEIAQVEQFMKSPEEALLLAEKVMAEIPPAAESLIPPLLSELDWGDLSVATEATETASTSEYVNTIGEEEAAQLGDLLAALPTDFDAFPVITDTNGEAETSTTLTTDDVDAEAVSYEPVPAFEPAFLVPPEQPTALTPKAKLLSETDENRIIWQMFREELPEQLMSLDSLMQRLTINPQDKEVCRSFERELHTLKGGARMAGLMDMGDLAHTAETTLEQMSRVASADAAKGSLAVLQNYIDQIHALAEQYVLEAPLEAEVMDTVPTDTKLLDKAIEAARTEPPVVPTPATEPETAEVVEFAPVVREITQSATEYPSVLEQMLVQKAHTLPNISALLVGQSSIAPANDGLTDELAAFSSQEQIRLPASFLDNMIDQAGALNVQHNGLSERLRSMSDDVREFSRTAVRLRQLLRSLELETEAHVHAGLSKIAAQVP